MFNPVQRMHVPVSHTEAMFKVIVLTHKRVSHLRSLLRDLENAEYAGDQIDLEIHIDRSTAIQKVIDVARSAAFSHGPKRLIIKTQSVGLASAWFQAWDPKSTLNQRSIIFEDDIILSPYWYLWVKAAWQKYSNVPGLAGISLQRQTLIPQIPHEHKEIVNAHAPFLYKLVGSIGFSPNSAIWEDFLQWLKAHTAADMYVPELITSEWWRTTDKTQMWTQHFIYFCTLNNLYTLYINLPNERTLAGHMRAKGAHFPESLGADFQVAATVSLQFPDVLRKYGWDGKICSNTAIDHVEAELLVEQAQRIQDRVGFAYLMFINHAYINLAKSWICNVLLVQESALRETIIITPDYDIARQIRELNKALHVFVFESNATEAGSFGTFSYHRTVHERMRLQNLLIQRGINIMIIEADQVWLRPITKQLQPLFQRFDLLASDELHHSSPRQKYVCAGFYGISSTNRTRGFFESYFTQHTAQINFFQTTRNISDFTNDQVLLSQLLPASGLKVKWFDKCMYSNGMWYNSSSLRDECQGQLALLHNNYIVGNLQKIERAKKWKHWFLSSSDKCMHRHQ